MDNFLSGYECKLLLYIYQDSLPINMTLKSSYMHAVCSQFKILVGQLEIKKLKVIRTVDQSNDRKRLAF